MKRRPRMGRMIPALPMGLAAAGWMTAWAATGAELHASGYYKNLLSVTDVSDNYRNLGVADRDAAIDDAQRVRLKLATSPAPGWDLLAHYEVRAAWGDSVRIRNRLAGMPAPLPVPTETAGGRVRFLDLESTFHRGSNLTLAHDLDRLQARVRAGETDITVGRQAVSWGVGLLWSPADLFAGFAPDEIDRDEKLGVDVVRIRCPVGSDWLVDMVAEPLDQDGPGRMDPDDSSLAARATTHLGEYDVSLLGGRIAGDAVVGADFSGYLRDAGFRGELVHTRVREDDERDYNRLLLSVDYGFAAAWNPYLAVEYLYNGLGAADADDYVERLGAASVQRAVSRANAFNLGRHYVGVMSSVQPTALWTLQSVTVCNVRDGSTVEYATAVRSLHENMDLVLGLHVGLGGLGTEFGGLSKEQSGVDFANADFAFAFLKWYF